ncbi:MAG: AAA family ATPase [Deltaproteobacteria bacterium]|nr:AAA family ATPase [Deltaproteobacteria bacterium]
MLTRLRIRNFKRFGEADVELGQSVVFIGPNNSGKTTALQALALWNVGLRRWNERREGKTSPEKRPGVTINRRDLIAIPVPDANLLWRNLHVRDVRRTNGKQETQNIRVEVVVDGVAGGKGWSCGFEFDYANEESFYCRPLRLSEDKAPQRMPVPAEAADTRFAYLPPMSGLAATEPKWETGRINVLLGEGQTAQVLRNLCCQIYEQPDPRPAWKDVCAHIESLFGARLQPPQFIKERGEITMTFGDRSGCVLDLSSAGRGLQQTLLLLAHLYANPKTVLLLDEPDAHLEVLRQRQIYQLLTDVASSQGSQVIAASHSEVVLNEAANRDVVIAFVGRPHRIDDRGQQVVKALTDIGFDHYYQADLNGWVLYLEGATDLAILRAFARVLAHPVARHLERPFVHYLTTNLPTRAREHFFALQEARTDLVGLALFDRLEKPLHSGTSLTESMWQKREIENYLCQEEVLVAYARHEQPDDLFGRAEAARREQLMRECISEVTEALATLNRPSPWSAEIKASNEFLDPVFERFFRKVGLPNLLRKTDFHVLAGFVPKEKLDPEITAKLDEILTVAQNARPNGE